MARPSISRPPPASSLTPSSSASSARRSSRRAVRARSRRTSCAGPPTCASTWRPPPPARSMSRDATRSTAGASTPVCPPTLRGQAERAARDEAVARDDLVDDGLRHRGVRGDRHDGDVGAGAVLLAGRLAADCGVGDVHAVLAEAGADAADHAGHVAVAEQGQVLVVHLEVEALAPGLEQVRAVQATEGGADDTDPLSPAHDADPHEVGEVAGDDLLALGDLDAALLGQGGR